MATCCGQRVQATEETVQALLTARGLTAAEQAREWLAAGRSLAEPRWMQTCVAHAREMADLVVQEREVLELLGGSAQAAHTGRQSPPDPTGLAERRFEWLGDRKGVALGVLRDGIAELARMGYVSPDAGQQAALRRALGATASVAEANSRGPWAVWLGEADALNYLVESLWQMGLIHCPGGQRYKWQTLCGAFLRADGSRFPSSIKNNRCTNPLKRQSIDEALLNALRFVCGGRGATA